MNLVSIFNFYLKANTVKRLTNKTIFSQIKDILRLRNFPNCLSKEEYYNLKLYQLSISEQNTFLGSALEGPINYILASPFWFSTIRDKLSFYNILKTCKVNTPKIIAIYGTDGQIGTIPTARTASELQHLLETLRPPYFGKPSIADVGVGTIRVEGIDKNNLILADGETISISNLVMRITKLNYGNFIFQEMLVNAHSLRNLVGEKLSTVRVCMYKSLEGPVVYRAFLKVCLANNFNDNWDYGRTGNALAFIDVGTGTISHVVSGEYPNVSFSEDHPISGKKLAGKIMPHWEEIRSLCENISGVFIGINLLHLDIAITPEGPSIVEINEDGSLLALQELGKKGFYSSEFKAFLAEHGHDLLSKETQLLISKTGAIVEWLYGMDNSINGRGTPYSMVTSMK